MILGDREKIRSIVKEEITAIRDKYGDERRTRIEEVANEIIDEDLVEKHTCVMTLTHAGYVKRLPSDTYSAQHRGGKGVTAMTTREEDFIEKVMTVHSHSTVLFFTNTGRVQTLRAFQIPEASRTARGSNIINLIQLAEGESVTAMIAVDGCGEGEYLLMVTKRGIIKRTLLSEFEYQRKGGKIALTLDEGDELLYVLHTRGDSDILIATSDGRAVRYSESNVRPMGRTARGVIGISLRGEDCVVGAVRVEPEKRLVTVTENGFGKLTPFDEFRVMTNRGGLGVTCQKCTDKTGRLAGILAASEDDDLMLITDQGIIIRTPAQDISELSRTAAGVIVMRLEAGQKLVNLTRIDRGDEESKNGEKGVSADDGADGSGAEVSDAPDTDAAEDADGADDAVLLPEDYTEPGDGQE